MKFYYLLPVILCVGCSNTGIIPMDKDMYMISKRSAKVPYTTATDEKADVYLEANDFCAKQGKTVETIKLDMTSAGFIRPASAALEFRCVLVKETPDAPSELSVSPKKGGKSTGK